MNERLESAFEKLIDRMEDPPSWERITSYEARLTSPPATNHGWLAFAAGVAGVAVLGVFAVLLAGDGRSAAGSIPYVRIAWHQNVEMRCLGMEIIDNGGFDSAVIEIWGPTSDNVYRLDATAPDGTVDRQIVEMDGDQRPVRSWFSVPRMGSRDSAFRVTDCAESDTGGTHTYAMAQPPLLGIGNPFLTFVRFPDSERSERLASLLADGYDSRRPDEWRGIPVAVFSRDDSGINELGSFTKHRELWADLDRRRAERTLSENEFEVLGSSMLTTEVTDRAEVPAGDVSFSTGGLYLNSDRSQVDQEDVPAVTTTSVTPLAEPLMEDAREIGVDDIFSSELRAAMSTEEGDQLFRVPFQDFAVLVRIRAGHRPHMYATSCDVLARVELPGGWEGTCLERTVDGERKTGRFPYGTTSE